MKKQTIPKLISILFHPVFMPTIGMILTLRLQYFFFLSFQQKLNITLIFSLFTLILPLFFLLILILQKEIKNIYVYQKEERQLLLLLSLFSFSTGIYVLYKTGFPIYFLSPFIGALLALIFIFIFNFFFKISIHTTAWGALCSSIFLLSYTHFSLLLFLISILIAGIVGSARIQLKAHNYQQVFIGYFLGVSCVFFSSFLSFFKI